ncbi:MAG: chromophore lyase CpcT/CpeT [Phycisphaerales bacterium]
MLRFDSLRRLAGTLFLSAAGTGLLPAGGCATDPTWAGNPTWTSYSDEQLSAQRRLTSWMIGSFASADQSLSDPAYRDVSLVIAPVWKSRTGCWLYVEQAMAESPDRPYRQRLYRLTGLPILPGQPLSWRCDVFSLPGDPLRFAGAWQEPYLLESLHEDDLLLRDGCSVWIFQVSEEEFAGSTRGNACASDLHGAAYATSHVTIRRDRIDSWDRGYDASGAQVWGPARGPYCFRRAWTE